MNWKKLFCDHKYEFLGEMKLKAELSDGKMYDVPAQFFQCSKCGKRKIIKFCDSCYNTSMLEHFRLWEKGQITLKFLNGGKEGILYV